VEFNDELWTTNIHGFVRLLAPNVKNNSLFLINSSKDNYVNDSRGIIVKNMPEFKISIVYGEIKNLSTAEGLTTFEAVKTKCFTFLPFRIIRYKPGDIITTSEYYFGILNPEFIFSADHAQPPRVLCVRDTRPRGLVEPHTTKADLNTWHSTLRN